jgi:hypothetical protein
VHPGSFPVFFHNPHAISPLSLYNTGPAASVWQGGAADTHSVGIRRYGVLGKKGGHRKQR